MYAYVYKSIFYFGLVCSLDWGIFGVLVHLHIAAFLGKANNFCDNLGPVVESIVSLTSSLRGRLLKCFATL